MFAQVGLLSAHPDPFIIYIDDDLPEFRPIAPLPRRARVTANRAPQAVIVAQVRREAVDGAGRASTEDDLDVDSGVASFSGEHAHCDPSHDSSKSSSVLDSGSSSVREHTGGSARRCLCPACETLQSISALHGVQDLSFEELHAECYAASLLARGGPPRPAPTYTGRVCPAGKPSTLEDMTAAAWSRTSASEPGADKPPAPPAALPWAWLQSAPAPVGVPPGVRPPAVREGVPVVA